MILAILAGFGSHYGRAYWIKSQGVMLVPKEAHPVAPVPFYLQDDPQWADDSLGSSPYRMRGSGCLVACLAAAANSLGVDTDPARLNQAFGAKGVYTPAGEVIWTMIKEAVPGVDYEYSRVFGADTIEGDLAEGRLPIVKVKYRGSGAAHWLLVVGAAEDDFLVMDPLNAERTPLRLSTHGKVYAYRVLVPGAAEPGSSSSLARTTLRTSSDSMRLLVLPGVHDPPRDDVAGFKSGS